MKQKTFFVVFEGLSFAEKIKNSRHKLYSFQIFEKQEISNFSFSYNSPSVVVSDGKKVSSNKTASSSDNTR